LPLSEQQTPAQPQPQTPPQMDDETRQKFNDLEDAIRILDLEVKILNATLDLQQLNQTINTAATHE